MVVVLDNANRTWQMLQLNRDSIVQVPVRGVQGDIIAYEDEQLALAYYYGDGREASCENTVLTVSMLLDGQTIDGYAAVNMDAVGIITDMVGGVTLTVTSDFSAIDPTLVEGETITLYGDQALTYVRSRYNIDDETNLARMARQRQYLAALKKSCASRTGISWPRPTRNWRALWSPTLAAGRRWRSHSGCRNIPSCRCAPSTAKTWWKENTGPTTWTRDSLQQTILELFYQEIEQ